MDGGAIFLLVVPIIIIAAIITAIVKSTNREDARLAYQQRLAQLKADPTNADLRQSTLELGRAYSRRTRNEAGIPSFDEVALMNDINAACAGATGAANSPRGVNSRQSIEERLAKLADLKSQGLIDDEEYRTRKKEILDEV
jgi:hypothetical protein